MNFNDAADFVEGADREQDEGDDRLPQWKTRKSSRQLEPGWKKPKKRRYRRDE